MRVITTCPTCGIEVVYTDTGIVLPGAARRVCAAGHPQPRRAATEPAPPSTVPTGETVVFMSPRGHEAFMKNLRRALSADERYRPEEEPPAQEGPVPAEIQQQVDTYSMPAFVQMEAPMERSRDVPEWRNPWPLPEPALFGDDVPLLWTEQQQERIREMVVGVDPAQPGSERQIVVIAESTPPGGMSYFERVRRALREEALAFPSAGDALRSAVEAHIPPPPEPARPMNRAQRRRAERLEAWRKRRSR